MHFEAHARPNQTWTSGPTSGAAQHLVLPAAAGLLPDTTYTWHVRVWLSTGGGGDGPQISRPATFDTAPASFPGAATWLGGGGQLRARAGLKLPRGTIQRARVWVSGLGAYYLFINGRRVGTHVMDPPQTVYSKTVLFNTHDVGQLLAAASTNHVGVLLGTYKWGARRSHPPPPPPWP
jgi:alpha-L-rhamnosidase